MRRPGALVVAALVIVACGEAAPPPSSTSVLDLIDTVVVQETDSLFVGRPVDLLYGPNGALFVSDGAQARVLEIARDGRITRAFGRKGRGPGEFVAPSFMGMRGDTVLLVRDGAQMLLQAIHVRTGAFVGSVRTPPGGGRFRTEGEATYFAALNADSGTALIRLASDGSEQLEGALPALARESPMLLGPFPSEVFVFVDSTVYALTELSGSLLWWKRGSRDLHSVNLPRSLRRGVNEDDYRAMLKDPEKAAAIAFNHSVPMLLERTASGYLAAVMYDVERVRDAFTGRFYITLIDIAQQRACVDIPLPAPEDPPARLAIVGDTVVSIEQDVGAGEGTVTTVKRYLLRGERCAWVKMGGGADGSAVVQARPDSRGLEQRRALAGASKDREIRTDRLCITCRLRIEQVAEIDDDAMEVARFDLAIVQLTSGEFLIGGSSAALGVFDTVGRFVRSIGRVGSGPGEFRSISKLRFGVEDSVLVYDARQQRLTILDPLAQRAIRTLAFPAFRDLVAQGDNTMLLSGHIPTKTASGFPMHRVDATGGVQHSFGEWRTVQTGVDALRFGYSLVRRSSDGAYAAPDNAYRIEEWNHDERNLVTLVRSARWFPPQRSESVPELPFRAPAPPRLLGLAYLRASDRLYVNVSLGATAFVPDSSLLRYTGEMPLSALPSGAAVNRYFDTVIEILDPTSGSLLVSQRLPGLYNLVRQSAGRMDGPLYWRYSTRNDGSETVEIVRIVATASTVR